MKHFKTIAIVLLILVSTTACMFGGVPFKLFFPDYGPAELISEQAGCSMQQDEYIPGGENIMNTLENNCIVKVCILPQNALSQLCRAMRGDGAPEDIEVSFTLQSIVAFANEWHATGGLFGNN